MAEDGYEPPEPPRATIEGFVAAALDDVEAGRLTVESALELLVKLAWKEGHRAGRQRGPDASETG